MCIRVKVHGEMVASSTQHARLMQVGDVAKKPRGRKPASGESSSLAWPSTVGFLAWESSLCWLASMNATSSLRKYPYPPGRSAAGGRGKQGRPKGAQSAGEAEPSAGEPPCGEGAEEDEEDAVLAARIW